MTATGPLRGRVALVTGSTRNIGLAIAARLGHDGAMVAINGPTAGETAQAAATLRADGITVLEAPGDVSDPAQVHGLVAAVITAAGTLDLVVNNAAVPTLGRVPMLELDIEAWDRTFAVNARGLFLCSQAAARWMRDHPAPGRALVHVSSVGAARAHRNALAYDASKGAVEAATRAMALELAPFDIRVNAVAPGLVSGDRFDTLPASEQRARTAVVPLGRAATGAEIAACVAFLCAPDAAYVTGHVLTVDGGLACQSRPPGFDPVPTPTSSRPPHNIDEPGAPQ